jgi:hypothetical protein
MFFLQRKGPSFTPTKTMVTIDLYILSLYVFTYHMGRQ